MREILFRGKIIELCEYQGQWLEGFYAVENGKPFIAIPKENGLNGFYCDPETVGQYTGLKDVHRKKVFEGDVVRVFDGECINYAVSFDGKHGAFVIGNTSFWYYAPDIEVIGNIYDNPELIGGSQDDRSN